MEQDMEMGYFNALNSNIKDSLKKGNIMVLENWL